MLAVSDYLAKALLNQVFRGIPYVPPEKVYVALYTSNPTGADTGTEVAGGAYERLEVQFTVPAASGGKQTIGNSSDLAFPAATADWGAITYVGIRDAEADGNLLYYGPLKNQRTILVGDVLKFLAGTLAPSLN